MYRLPQNSLGARDGTFLLLAWHEQFDEGAPDTFRHRLHDLEGLIQEYGEIARLADHNSNWERSLPVVWEEIEHALTWYKKALGRTPRLLQAINALKNETSRPRIRQRIDLLVPQFEGFSEGWLREVAAHSGDKRLALGAVRQLASCRGREGATNSECRDALSITGTTLTGPEAAELVIESTRVRRDTYSCFVPTRGPQAVLHRVIEAAGFRGRRPPSGPQVKDTEEAGYYWAHLEVEASSRAGAAREAWSKIRRAVDLCNFYHNSSVVELGPRVVVVGKDNVRVEVSVSAASTLKPRNKALNRSVNAIRKVSDRLPDGLAAALEYISLAEAQTEPRVQMVSLWMAVEALVGPDNSSIIDRAIDTIVPFVVSRRLQKIATYLAISLHHWLPHDRMQARYRISATDWMVPSERLIEVLARDKGDSDQCWLTREAYGNPLLTFHLAQLNALLRKPKDLAGEIAASQRRLRWQLRRIYRARNMIVHHGHEPRGIGFLVANLRYYLSMTVSQLITDLGDNVDWCEQHAFIQQKLSHDYLLDRLRNAPAELMLCDLLPHGAKPYRNQRPFR